MNKPLYKWEKHDVVNYLRVNFLETNVEFTTETLIKKIEKSGSYFYGYSEKVISQHLFKLSNEGYLSVRYISVYMKPKEHHLKENWRNRWGSKTVAVYQMVSRKEKIEKILKN